MARLEHLRGSALGFRNLTNYIARWHIEDIPGALVVIVAAVRPELLCADPAVGFEVVARTPVPASAIMRAYDIDSGAVLFEADRPSSESPNPPANQMEWVVPARTAD